MDSVAAVQQKVQHTINKTKMTPVLHYFPLSGPCRSVLLLSRMLELELDMKVVDIMAGDQMKPEFIQLNPQHCVPTLDDHGLVLWESRAILAYLVGCYGKDDSLYPSDLRVRALVDQRLQFDLATLYSRTVDYFFPTMMMGAPLDETKKARLSEALKWFDTVLKGRKYCAADNFTIADLTLTVTVSQIEAFGFELSPYGRIRAWLDICKQELEPHGYEEINGAGAEALAGVFRSKLKN